MRCVCGRRMSLRDYWIPMYPSVVKEGVTSWFRLHVAWIANVPSCTVVSVRANRPISWGRPRYGFVPDTQRLLRALQAFFECCPYHQRWIGTGTGWSKNSWDPFHNQLTDQNKIAQVLNKMWHSLALTSHENFLGCKILPTARDVARDYADVVIFKIWQFLSGDSGRGPGVSLCATQHVKCKVGTNS